MFEDDGDEKGQKKHQKRKGELRAFGSGISMLRFRSGLFGFLVLAFFDTLLFLVLVFNACHGTRFFSGLH